MRWRPALPSVRQAMAGQPAAGRICRAQQRQYRNAQQKPEKGIQRADLPQQVAPVAAVVPDIPVQRPVAQQPHQQTEQQQPQQKPEQKPAAVQFDYRAAAAQYRKARNITADQFADLRNACIISGAVPDMRSADMTQRDWEALFRAIDEQIAKAS